MLFRSTIKRASLALLSVMMIIITPSILIAQCVDEQFTTATLTSDDFGQSFTIPADGCGTLTNLVIQRRDGPSNNLNAVTATFELFVGETVSGVAQYTQTGITISANAGDKTILLSGGTGSLAVTAGAQYTWYLTLSANSDWQLGQGSSGEAYSGGRGYLLSSFQNGFDVDMTINSTAPPAVPVELVSFDAEQVDNTVALNWKTASELNNEGFEIQRSIDGENWNILDFVIGHGTTFEPQSYTYVDDEPLDGIAYYRLRQVDYDGQFEYSHTVEVAMEQLENAALQLYPNPVKMQLNIINAVGQATIYNTLGQSVMQFSIIEKRQMVNVADLPKGNYILKVQTEDGRIHTELFTK